MKTSKIAADELLDENKLCYERISTAPKASIFKSLWPRSHYSVFVSIRFCCIEATVHTAPFSYKNGEKNLRFCGYPLLTAFSKTSVFVAFLCKSV